MTDNDKEKSKMIGEYVLVTTKHRGVFAGIMKRESGKTVVLDNIRMCVLWAKSVRGVVGLAATGPNAGCKITAAAPQGTLYDVTSILLVSTAAQAAWEEGPWS